MNVYNPAIYEQNKLEENTFDPSYEEYNLYVDLAKMINKYVCESNDGTQTKIKQLKSIKEKIQANTTVNENVDNNKIVTKNKKEILRKILKKTDKKMKRKASEKKIDYMFK